MTLQEEQTRARTRNLTVGRVVLAALVVVLVAYASVTARHVVRFRRTVSQASTLSLDTLNQAGPLFDRAMADLDGLYRCARIPLWVAGRCGWVPRVGPMLRIAPQVADHGMALAHAGHGAFEIIRPWLESGVNPTDLASLNLSELLRLTSQAQSEMETYAKDARVAADALGQVHIPDPPDGLTLVQVGAQYCALGIEALALAPEVAGPEPRTYLLLAQNNHELRATGGFISAIGAVTISEDGFSMEPFQDSYKVENWDAPHPDPPEPLREHMAIDLWTTRDGNWWPDFPKSAQAVADLYELNQGVHVDGVLAADLYAAQVLLEAFTPLTLGSGQTVEAGSVDRLFRESWGLEPEKLRTDGVVITATRDYIAVEVGLQFPATEGQVWFDDVAVARLDGALVPTLANPSFEEDAEASGLPAGWQAEGLSGRDGTTSDVGLDGQSLTMIGDGETLKRVSQSIDETGVAGTAWRIAAQSAARGVPVGQTNYAMTVDFVGADGSRERHVASFPAFTHDWATAGSDVILGKWWRHRKDVIGEAMVAASAKALREPASINWPLVGLRTQKMLDEKHIQVAFFADGPAAWMAGLGWDGALRQTEPDFLMVVDSNVGFNKVTASIEETLDYLVNPLGSEGPISQVTLVYKNHSPATGRICDKYTQYVPTYDLLTQGCYWDYVRVYVPQGAVLLNTHASQQPIEQHDEGMFTVFSTSLIIPPGAEAEIRFTYRQRPFSGDYGLNLVKQAGVEGLDASFRWLAYDDPPEVVWDPPRETVIETIDGSLYSSHTLPIRTDSVIRVVPQEAFLMAP